jgi:hypothetical protein
MADEDGNKGGEDGNKGGEDQPGEFFSSLSEENQADPSAEKFKTADSNSMFKSYNELQAVVGKKGVILPKEGDADDMARFNAEIGGVTDASKYELSAVKDAGDLNYSQDAWKELCAKIGARPDQAQMGQDLIAESSRNMLAQMKIKEDEAFGEADQLVRAEMGDQYDINMSRVEKLIEGNASTEEGAKRLFEAVQKDPEAFHALSNVASLLSENVLGKISPLSAGKSPEQAQARIDEIMKDPDYQSDNESTREPLINEINDLERIKMGAKG